MRKIFLFLISAVLLASCAKEYEEVVEDTYEDGSPKTVKVFEVNGDEKDLVKEIAYYENKQKRLEGEYKDGQRNGFWQYWYENGNKWSEGYYIKGINDGKTATWHENGQQYYEGSFHNGERAGIWKFRDEKGEFIKEINYSGFE